MKTFGIAFLFVLGLLNSAHAADSWTGFQDGGELSKPAPRKSLPQWSPDAGIAWEAPLAGYGQSSPVIFEEIVYVTSTSGDNKETLVIQGIDLGSGKERWKYEAKNSTPQKSTNYISKAAPSPVCDENGVIAFFEGGNLIALDASGRLRWQRDLAADYGAIESRHGLSSSLEQTEGHVFAWVERSEDPYLLAVSKKDGKTAWKVDALGTTAWSSPRLVPVGDAQHLVLSGIGQLRGIDPESGKTLWSFDGITNNSTPTPIPVGNGRFLMGATVGRSNTDAGNAAASNALLEIKSRDDGTFAVDFVWRAKRATSSFGSPLAHNGYAYFVNRSGVVYCLDLKTGEELYAKRTSGSIWATPIGVGERIYLFGKDGTTTVIQSGPEFKELTTNSLWKKEAGAAPFGGAVLYAAALVDSGLVLRRGDRLYKISR